MQDQLAPNKTGNQMGRLDPSSTGYDQEAGNQNLMGTMPQRYGSQGGMAMRSSMQTPMMQGGEGGSRREKMRIYREKHREAKETFARIAGVPVETEADAVEVMARKLKGGTYRIRELLIPIFRNGLCSYVSPSTMEIQKICTDEKNTLWDETKRLTNPQEVYVDPSDRLYEMKQKLFHEMSRK